MFKKPEQPQPAEQPPVDPTAAILARLEAIEDRLSRLEIRMRYKEQGREVPEHLLPKDEERPGRKPPGFDRW